MNNEKLHAAKDQTRKQDQLVFENAAAFDGELSAGISEMISSSNRQKEPLGIRYEKVGTNPLEIDIYVEETLDKNYIASWMSPREEHIFPASDTHKKMQVFASTKASAATETELEEEASDVSNKSEIEEEKQGESNTFKGTLPNPPKPAEPQKK